jgi:hypothetical protein
MQQNDTLTISLGQFSKEKVDPAKLAAQILAAREANFKVILKADHPEAMELFTQLKMAMKQKADRQFGMPLLIALAWAVSMGTILVGIGTIVL